MKPTRILTSLAAAAAAALICAPTAQAAPPAAVPVPAGTSFEAFVSVREEYNDNIYLSHDGRVEDFITTLSPSFALATDRPIWRMALKYSPSLAAYAETSKLKLTQVAQLDTTFAPFERILFLKVNDVFERIPVDQQKPVGMGNILVNQTNSNNVQLSPYLEWQGTSTTLHAGYTYQNIWYSAEGADRANNRSAVGTVSRQITPDLTLNASYTYLWHRPTTSEAYDNQNVSGGLNWQLFRFLGVSGSGGRTFFAYKGIASRRTSATVWQAQANLQLSERFFLTGGYSENFSDSIKQGTFKVTGSNATLSYLGKQPIKLTWFQNMESYLDINRTDRTVGASIDGGVPVTDRLTAHLVGTYQHFTFLPQEERADRYTARLSMDYQLKMTTLSLHYTFNGNFSNLSQNSYLNDIVSAQATFTF